MNKKLLIKIIIILVIIAIGGYFIYSGLKGKETTKETEKWCKGVKIIFFPGGNEECSFASVVYNGAKAAEKDLGPSVEYVWSDWDPTKMVSQFKDVIAKSPDGIAIMGHPGSEALAPFVEEAERKNILVTLANVDLPDIREKYISNGFGYAGQALYNSGLMVSSGVIRKYNPKEGTEAIVFGVDPIKSPSRHQRTQGCIDALEKGKLVVHEITLPLEVEKDAKSVAAEKMFADALAKYPEVKVIITDHGAVTASAPLHLQKLGKKPNEIIVAGFDLSTDTVKGIKDGYIGLVHDQQPYLQGYLPILQICLTKKYSFAGLYIDTGVGLIDNSNVDIVVSLAEQKIR